MHRIFLNNGVRNGIKGVLSSSSGGIQFFQWNQQFLRWFVHFQKPTSPYTAKPCRLGLFARKQRLYDAIPPTKAPLIQHTRRATYQACCILGEASVCQMEFQSLSDWGWKKKIFGKLFGQHFLRLLRAVNMLMQDRMQWKVQVLSFKSALYSIMYLQLR